MRHAITAIMVVLAPAVAAQEFEYSNAAVEVCLAETEVLADRHKCFGASAGACMQENTDGYTTYGLANCLSAELEYWDGRLNASYAAAMDTAKSTDATLDEQDSAAPRNVPTLRDMQRAWIPFRDAACAYERAQWGGGTGGGPAELDCLLHLTAQQTLFIEDGLN